MKHANGPWKWEPSTQTIRSKENYWILTIDSIDASVDNDANARLVSAAPDLLTVARGCLGYLTSLPKDSRPDATWLEPLRDAINKAEGWASEQEQTDFASKVKDLLATERPDIQLISLEGSE